MLLVLWPLPAAGGFGRPGALGSTPRLPCEPTTCVGASSFCTNAGCWPSWPAFRLGRPLVRPPTGIGRSAGRLLAAEVAEGIAVAVEDGYSEDMLYCPYVEGGIIALLVAVGEMWE